MFRDNESTLTASSRDLALEVQLLNDRIDRLEHDVEFWYWFAMFSLFAGCVALVWLLIALSGVKSC